MYRIAWFSSQKENSTSELFSRFMLPELGKWCDLTVFSTASDREYLNAYRQKFDLHIYNFEDTKDSYFVRSHLGLIPGLTIFHDYFLTSDGPEPILNSPWEETVRKFADPKRPWADRSLEYKRERPQAFREAGLSLVNVFTDERSCAECSRVTQISLSGDNRHNFYLPFPATTSVRWEFNASRRAVGFCGTPRIEHRAHKLLAAIPENVMLLWMIEESEKDEALRLIQEFEIKNFELRVNKSPEIWDSVIRDSSCVCLPLFSVYSHLHPYLEMSLVSGVPTVVTKFGSTEYLSEKIVFHVSPGDHESAEFNGIITALLEGNFSQSLIRNIQTFGAEMFTPKIVARELIAIINKEIDFISEKRKVWSALERDARNTLIEDATKSVDKRWSLEETFQELGWKSE